jgi:hypothetical protein
MMNSSGVKEEERQRKEKTLINIACLTLRRVYGYRRITYCV